jgi:hypothetical protein
VRAHRQDIDMRLDALRAARKPDDSRRFRFGLAN